MSDTGHGNRPGPPEDPADTPDLVSVGGAMVDRYYRLTNLPEPDGGSFARESWHSFGGAAANVACAASRLGRESGMVTRLGTDEEGGHEWADAVETDLRDRDVDTARVRRGPETGTYSMILAGPGGGRMVVTGGDSVQSLRLRAGDWPYLRGAGVVATNAYAPDPVVADLVAARRDGRIRALAFDLSGPIPELRGRGTEPDTVDDAVAADLVVVGEVALRSYCEHHGVDPTATGAVDHLRAAGVRRAALTRGEEGATLVTPDETVEVRAFDVDVVDETGAGDAFFAGLIDAWVLEGRDPTDAGAFAAAVAALNCTGEGARGALPSREAARELVRERS